MDKSEKCCIFAPNMCAYVRMYLFIIHKEKYFY